MCLQLYGQLQRGQAVAGAGGIMVQPHQVMEAEVAGPHVMVAEVPDLRALQALASSERLRTFLVSLWRPCSLRMTEAYHDSGRCKTFQYVPLCSFPVEHSKC